MTLLLHVCCGPCLLYPALALRKNAIAFTGYFYNPNIHPYKEFKKRLEAARHVSTELGVTLIVDKDYGLKDFLRAVVFHEKQRCHYCYSIRLEKVASKALSRHFDSFSSTLLYSTYQNHALIINYAKRIAERRAVSFYYEDFRKGWQKGIDESLRRGIYRQSYCGCIYSEQERYDNILKKQLKKKRKDNV
ncbi:MAG: epoxyqueuosine reductase QueH [Desulfobacterales bacterium]|nr:epoxyqueuosine reductase QueH [Deltaproteobacteria bacterium]NNK97176.1 epoxyqueuosine reductase QueH [Desulfobacterales bacterium]